MPFTTSNTNWPNCNSNYKLLDHLDHAIYLRLDLIKQIPYNIHMDMFVALADPTRRNILELLANSGELPATAIYQNFSMSPPAVSQHLKVLREAHLVEMEKRAQQHVYRLNPEKLSEFEAWVKHMQQRWEERFAALDIVLEREKKKGDA